MARFSVFGNYLLRKIKIYANSQTSKARRTLGPQLSRKEKKPYQDSCQQSFWLQWEGPKSTITLSADRAGTDVCHADSSCSSCRHQMWSVGHIGSLLNENILTHLHLQKENHSYLPNTLTYNRNASIFFCFAPGRLQTCQLGL